MGVVCLVMNKLDKNKKMKTRRNLFMSLKNIIILFILPSLLIILLFLFHETVISGRFFLKKILLNEILNKIISRKNNEDSNQENQNQDQTNLLSVDSEPDNFAENVLMEIVPTPPLLFIPEKNPPESRHTSVRCSREKDFFSLWGSLIYWQARQSYMDVALASCCPAEINDQCGMSWKDAKRSSIDPDYEPGFKVGAEFTHKKWGTFLDFTSYEIKSSLSRNVSENGFLFARWIQPGVVADNAADHLGASWKLRFHVFNVGMGKRSHWGKHLILKPHFGVCIAQIDQSFKGRFSLIESGFLKVKNRSDSWGVGPRAGVVWDWRWVRRFGIVGNVAAGILYTHYDLDLGQRSPTDSTIFIRTSDHLDALRVEFEMFAGFDYLFLISKKVQMHCSIGYDFQVWWNQNMMRWNNDTTFVSSPEGNLYLQGLRFSLGMDF